MADNPDQQLAANPAAAAAASGLRLPQFWTDVPNSWFSMAEAQLRLRGVINNADKYCHLLAALPREAFRMVASMAAVAPLSDEEEAVAAVAGGSRRRAAHKKKKAKKGSSGSNNNGGEKQGLCYFHNKFGERAQV
jgi:hypothetical protein